MKFTKGNKCSPGRPKGSKNKNYLDASFWFSQAYEAFQEEKDPDKRMAVVRWATELIMQKVPMLPATPGDSLSNALDAQNLLNALEVDADRDPKTTSH